ncbi:glycoside hydrolase family 52 protein [Aliagarivorans marinus]|uniref:glycoside hydrolase family 52 protein n=1 Tax=Aliagarivorans marinus TaxID=561965 RepID=UPI0003F8ED5F|nr:glycoside hydrolase family 52 protein [Aliagarivorans marinus]
MKLKDTYFHAHHSPMGALSSFTVGDQGGVGGLGLELGEAYGGNVFVGYVDDQQVVQTFPFFQGANDQSERYVQKDDVSQLQERCFDGVERDYGWSSDCFSAPGIEMKILTPFFSIADPELAQLDRLKQASCPAVYLELSFDNQSEQEWTGFFALQGEELRWNRIVDQQALPLKGVSNQDRMGIATLDARAEAFSHFSVRSSMGEMGDRDCFMLGPTGGLKVKVQPGERYTLRIALGVYIEGNATYNRQMRYYYTQHFNHLNDVLRYGLENFDSYAQLAQDNDRELAESGLSDDQQFLIAHATRSYYGSTQWLYDGTQSVWVVNEGEYLMMNTLDLTVDMLFFEMKMNPWTVRNVLEQLVSYYSYYDETFDPANPEQMLPGGLSFVHDMGVANNWSPKGHSSYEIGGLDRACFSYMTYEQLTNWVLCAGVYVTKSGDNEFRTRYKGILLDCLQSLLNRDHPDAAKRDGIMSMESSRTHGGGEITTYDSLDHSLGQARGNIYLAGKAWASYLVLEKLLSEEGLQAQADEARQAATMCANKLAASFDEELGFIPAVLDGESKSAIIPAIEALVYPYELGLLDAVAEDGPFGDYIKTLKRHLLFVLNSDYCLYPDNAWKLSSTADNSWASKIFLNQYVAREVLGMALPVDAESDAAHLRWQTHGAHADACCDQFSSGKPIGSKYYPRCVTNILWMQER